MSAKSQQNPACGRSQILAAAFHPKRFGSRSFRGSQRRRYLFDTSIMAMHHWNGNVKTSRTGVCSRSNCLHCHLELRDPLKSGFRVGREEQLRKCECLAAQAWGFRSSAYVAARSRTNGSRRSARPGAHHRAGDRCWGELLRHCSAVWRWRIGEKSRLCPAKAQTGKRGWWAPRSGCGAKTSGTFPTP